MKDKINAKVSIGRIGVTMFNNFPNLELTFKNVKIEDSLSDIHKRPLLDLENVYIDVNLWSLPYKKIEVENITVSDGKIIIFRDSSNYTNQYIFKNENKDEKDGLKLNKFNLEIKNVNFVFEQKLKEKYFDFLIEKMNVTAVKTKKQWAIEAPLNMLVNDMAFRTSKGGFLKGAKVVSTLKMLFDEGKKHLTITPVEITAGTEILNFSADVFFADKPVKYNITMESKAFHYNEGMKLFNKEIRSKIGQLKVDKTVEANAILQGQFNYPDTPKVVIKFKLLDNTINTPFGAIEHTGLVGTFQNQVIYGGVKNGDNSSLFVKGFKGTWEDIFIQSDSIYIYNFDAPYLNYNVKSNFELPKLNDVLSKTFEFKKGSAILDLTYRGFLHEDSLHSSSLDGFLKLDSFDFTYKPKQIPFVNCFANLNFKEKNVAINNAILKTKSSIINVDGGIQDFLNIFSNATAKSSMQWHIKSTLIDLADFINVIKKKEKNQYGISGIVKSEQLQKFNESIYQLIDASDMIANIEVDKIRYHKFNATGVKSNLNFYQNGFNLKQFSFYHHGGKMQMSGNIIQDVLNTFAVKVKMENAKVDKVFSEFDNFGMASMKDGNLRGQLFSDIDINGQLTDNGTLMTNAINGKVRFNLKNGLLEDFEPLLKIQKFAFKRRNLDSLVIKPLVGNFDIGNGLVFLNNFKIETSAINIFMKGVYGIEKGTNIAIKLPLRNPQKDEIRIKSGLAPKTEKGLVLYFKATDGDDGRVNIQWDPLKAAWNN
ncbi:AsmA-like C-terminal region-containing protein [Polluticaenibacter yanchengensis]|uniref:AsmA-like C-terminal domain-containing protein n=1 Tax=Polluticaenibacter yanchengensis TaxID=3014562 RepID=A0ABT4UI62_9BACT|nr:hypothetical protein [Chitinophagaceae bacterium LY-5]